MTDRRSSWIAAAVCGSVFAWGACGAAFAAPKKKAPAGKPARTSPAPAPKVVPLTEEQKIVHVLNRLGFGPRPGDVDRVRAMGLNRYIELQLDPQRIPDERVEAKLASLTMLQASSEQLADAYVQGMKNAVRLKKLRDEIGASGQQTAGTPVMDSSAMTDSQREEIRQILEQGRKGVAVGGAQLQVAKVVRAIDSERQLYELMVDFWTNHFNIDIRKNLCRAFKIVDDREVIRTHAMGRFRDLLGASAKSPAMLVYLDNAQSQVPQMVGGRRGRPGQPAAPAQTRGGINENYARELMELHTLGVDGGYTQKDVQEVARCLTGWSIDRQTGRFLFTPRRHDDGEKIVLGRRIPAGGGIKDGEMVLDMLARHPATARFVSRKLCQRLVGDEPPDKLVERCAAVWERTDGDIREVLRVIVTSPEFYSPATYRKKIKSPFEFAVSAVRALGGETDISERSVRGGPATLRAAALVGQIGTMGEPLFQCQPPTGYSVDSRKWVSAGALISRLNFTLSLTQGQISGVDLTSAKAMIQSAPTPEAVVERIVSRVLPDDLTPATKATLLEQAKESGEADTAALSRRVAALVLGSPEFQRR